MRRLLLHLHGTFLPRLKAPLLLIPACARRGRGAATLVDCLELSELVVKWLADVDATSSTLYVLDCLGKGHPVAFHDLHISISG